jgi:hypothetical protein
LAPSAFVSLAEVAESPVLLACAGAQVADGRIAVAPGDNMRTGWCGFAFGGARDDFRSVNGL